MWTVKSKSLPLVNLLLLNGADPSLEDQNGNNVLFQALEDASWDETSFLVLLDSIKNTKRLDVDRTNKTGTSLMHLAVKREWVQAVIVLVEEKAGFQLQTSNAQLQSLNRLTLT